MEDCLFISVNEITPPPTQSREVRGERREGQKAISMEGRFLIGCVFIIYTEV